MVDGGGDEKFVGQKFDILGSEIVAGSRADRAKVRGTDILYVVLFPSLDMKFVK